MTFRRSRVLALAGLTTALAATTAVAAPGAISRGPSTPTNRYELPVDGVSTGPSTPTDRYELPVDGVSRGPSTPTDPYVLPVADGVSTKSLLTVSDAGSAGNGYEMVGIPDGLGAFKRPGSRDFTLFMNHELRGPSATSAAQGIARRHGRAGAFVSELDVDSDSHEVESGRDLIDRDVRYWDYPTQTYRTGTPSSGGTNHRDATDTFIAQIAEFVAGSSCCWTARRRPS